MPPHLGPALMPSPRLRRTPGARTQYPYGVLGCMELCHTCRSNHDRHEDGPTGGDAMKLNAIERAAMNNPLRAAHRHHREAARFAGHQWGLFMATDTSATAIDRVFRHQHPGRSLVPNVRGSGHRVSTHVRHNRPRCGLSGASLTCLPSEYAVQARSTRYQPTDNMIAVPCGPVARVALRDVVTSILVSFRAVCVGSAGVSGRSRANGGS
jgi:hypothetical protein